MSKLQIHTDELTEVLFLQYSPVNDSVIYDICDLNGNIIKTGFVSGKPTSISLTGFNPGNYQLFLVDGGKLYKEKFELDQAILA